MSKLKTYDRAYGFDADFQGGESPQVERKPLQWPFDLIDGPRDGNDVLAPGKWVSHRDHGGFGVIIAVNDEQLTILWSQEPKSGDFSNIAFPVVRRVFPSLIANIVSVQPMTQPVGSIFYMDYVYGGDKLEKRCNSGPRVCMMFWRAYRCLKTRIQSLSSSLVSSWRSWRTPSMTTGNEAKRLLDKWSPVSGTQNGPTQQKIVEEYLKRQGRSSSSR